MKGYLEMCGALIERGAEMGHTDQYGKDAQDYAAEAGYTDVAKVRWCGVVWCALLCSDVL
jgi:hypothetical protein